MDRAPLLRLLASYAESGRLTAEERESFDRLVEFVRREPRCFERATREGHITGSAWILNYARTHCLLTHHKRLGLWLQPGGHADGDPDVFRVALREAVEESGIAGITPLTAEVFDVDVHRIPQNPKDPEHLHFDVRFAFVAPEGARFVVSEESHDLAWVARTDLPAYGTDASVLRMATKWSP